MQNYRPSVTEDQYKDAEKLLIKYADDMNAKPARAYSGDSRKDIMDAHQTVRRWGFESEYRFENGKQVLYIGNILRN